MVVNLTRRAFLKGIGALAAKAAVPKLPIPKIREPYLERMKNLSGAPPWVASMTNMLKDVVDINAKNPNIRGRLPLTQASKKLPNGTEIHYLGSPLNKYDSHRLAIKTADGNEDLINFREGKKDITIEFDIADDFATNQYLEIDKKTGYTEMIDSNLRMAPGGEDVIKDDPIVWALEKDKHKWSDLGDTLESKDHLNDFYSVPDDTDYSHLWERFVDSFSPAGNIFNTKKFAQAEKAKRLAQKEADEMNWEEQFRRGSLHGFNKGGFVDVIPPLEAQEYASGGLFKVLSKLGYQKGIPALKKYLKGKTTTQRSDEILRALVRRRREQAKYNKENFEKLFKPETNFQTNRPYSTVMSERDPRATIQAVGTEKEGYIPLGQISSYGASKRTGNLTYETVYSKPDKYGNNKELGIKLTGYGGEYIRDLSGLKFKNLSEALEFLGKKLKRRPMDLLRTNKFADGGIVKYDNMKDVVPPLDGYAAGGVGKLVIKKAPKVIEKLREWAPQITGKVAKPEKPFWTVFDEAGLPIKDFNTEKAARDFLRKDPTANMYKVGKSTDKTTKTKTEDAPAMFFRSREEIIQGPPIMTGQQWMEFLKARGVRDAEMMDTSLGPWLSANTKNKVSKNDLINKFDEMVPDFDVQVMGKDFREAFDMSSYLRDVDSTVFSPEAGKIIRFLQAQTSDITDDKAGAAALKNLDDLFENAYGIKNVTKEGIPADNVSVPYEIKQVMTDVLSATRQRGVGMEDSAFVDRATHGAQQVFGSTSGKNYREFLFGWKPKGPRKNEPKYSYAHSFGSAKGENAFMHARVSDRVDEYGNKLLFVEEFQSDMHQPISAAIRKADKAGKKVGKEGKYFPRLDVAVAKSNQSNLEQMANIQRQIDRLLETNPKSPKLAKLYEQKDMIRGIEADKASNLGKNTSGIPEGPFKDSQDYMEFAIKYLMRVAKDGNYDGVAFSTPTIKNLGLSRGNKDYQGNIIAYGQILKNAIRKAKSKSGADLVETSIEGPGIDRGIQGRKPSFFGVPALMLKGNKKALEKISKGLPAYKEGGLTKTVPPEKGPLPYGIFKDVVPRL